MGQLHFDVVISGGGMVGACLAHALSGQGLKIAVIEAYAPDAKQQPSYDDRAIALAYGSSRILQSLSLWQELSKFAEPIRQIHVSEQGRFGFARLDQSEEGVEALGYVVTARNLGLVLVPGLQSLSDVTLFCPASLESFADTGDAVEIEISTADSRQQLTAGLLVAADGGKSRVRQQLGIEVSDKAYGESAIISNVSTQQPHHNVAYERFTENGPVALLPMTEQRCGLVYSVDNAQLEATLALSDNDFLAQLQRRFGYRLGRFERVGSRVAYELRLKEVAEHVRPRIALIGNAAHTVHPIAGQGFNLGIRDVAALAEVIVNARDNGEDPGSLEVLQRYANWRQGDQRAVIRATDGMARLFGNPLGAVRSARNLGILAADMLPGARHWISRLAMGLAGRQSRLARGVPLGQ